MKFVYLIMSGEGSGRVLGVCSTEFTATNLVNNNARVVHGINPDKEPLDFYWRALSLWLGRPRLVAERGVV